MHLHGSGAEEEASIQESVERTAQVSRVIFNAPPAFAAYAYVVIASALFGLLLRPGLLGIAAGFLLLGVPALLAGPLSTPLANALGGTLYYRRAAFLAAVGVTLVGAAILIATPLQLFLGFRRIYGILFGYMMTAAVRHAVLYATSDNRHSRTLVVSLLHPAIGIALAALLSLPGRPLEEVVGTFDRTVGWLILLLPFVYLGPLLFALHIFDTPLKRNFKVSASELFRYYLDHITSGRMDGEAIIGRFAEPIRAKFGVVSFRRRDGTVKAVVVVPALHPGPIGRLGGSDLPGKVAEAVDNADLVMVPHGPATHDYNPVFTSDVERFGKAVKSLVEHVEYREGGSRAVTAGSDIRVTAQLFGNGALLTYTSWPAPIDDVDYGVGHAAELSAKLSGVGEALFVDCHNSLKPGAGAVFLCTPRADEIIERSRESAEEARRARVETLRVGVAQDSKTFTKADGIGDQGVQVLAVEAGGQKHAYVLWDGNNAVPEVTGAIGKALAGLVDSFQVMTTDNHSVNAVAGAYGPVGHLAPVDRIATATRLAVERALSDLEPVASGFARGVLEDFRVYGNQKTVQLASAVNVMTSIIVELLAATMLLQILGTILVFYALGIL